MRLRAIVQNQELLYLLNKVTSYILKVRQAHWNCTGPNFMGLHELYSDMYESLAEGQDLIAERIRQLHGEALLFSITCEVSSPNVDFVAPIYSEGTILVDQINLLIAKAEPDQITMDILTEICRELQKNLWKLRSHNTSPEIAISSPLPLT